MDRSRRLARRPRLRAADPEDAGIQNGNCRDLQAEVVCSRGMLTAGNQHELMHCLEVLNLLDLGELVFVGGMERRESRERHVRTDFPFQNPLMAKLLIIRKEKGDPVTSWRNLKR